jgi:hypothetical protein
MHTDLCLIKYFHIVSQTSVYVFFLFPLTFSFTLTFTTSAWHNVCIVNVSFSEIRKIECELGEGLEEQCHVCRTLIVT